ncbi:related to TGL4-triacylglycerol lipase [Serendipita indica DSM 11827]|uniref:Patatin-like phospholipase domain-containing protein n=1 Tax=Serendipita indica (strain DSM 11827) TaxID=1109443 RepID=G4TGP2_SERID|nr:related to TGL4-triacylglycerol lipase [Serendipita indica DSM 11827]
MSTAGANGDDLYADFINQRSYQTYLFALEAHNAPPCSHIAAFAAALKADDDTSDQEASGATSPLIPATPKPQGRTRKISALSDFAPIATRVKRQSKRVRSAPQREFVFQLARWPLLFLLAIVIFGQFGLYVAIRQVVNALEWLFAWRGRKGVLRKKLRSAQSYEEWKEAALKLDEYLGFDEWKREEEDPYHDYLLVKKVRRSLRSLRQKNDARGLLGVLDLCLRANFAGTESARLYSETFYGTKDSVEAYINEVEAAIDFVRRSPDITLDEKRRFFKSANRNVGSSALCLSGGATFGYYHFGVVKALLDANLLPRVIAGTSCGSLIAALVCTRTDEELKKLLVPELADRITACEEGFFTWFRRFLRTGARFDTVDWAQKTMFFTRGSMTFREAYELTGRVLNVSVIPFDRHSPTKLLNYLTAPDCVIWTAVLASAAVPGILNPVVLMEKTKNGTMIPWNWGSRFKDGSLRVDIPLQSLNLLFNVSHPIVSQVNPHVHLFFFSSRGSAGKPVAHRKGKGWRGGFLLSAAEQFLKHELTKNFKDWVHILSDPSRSDLERMLKIGEHVTWPRIHMIENRFRIERKIFRGRLSVKRASQVKGDRTPAIEGTSGPSPAALHAILSSTAANHADTSSGGAGHHTPKKFPASLGSEQIAVESDAEAGFAAGSERFFKKAHGKSNRRASQSLAQIDTSNSRQHPDIIVQTASPEDRRKNSAGNYSTMPSPIRRRRWGSSIYNAFSQSHSGEPSTAPISTGSQQAETNHVAPMTSVDPNNRSFFARLRSTSFNALASPFVRAPNVAREADVRSLTSAQLADERWSSDSSSEDEFLWNNERTAAESTFAIDVGEEELNLANDSGLFMSNAREDEDADLTTDLQESP